MRAQITINLTWIFALIAGILVFGMIIAFSTKQKEESDLTISFSILEYIETEFKTIAKTKNTFSRIETVKSGLEIVCENPEESVLMLRGAPNVKPIRYQALFSPKYLEGNTFLAWTQEWLLPTSVDTFLYLSNPETLFVIVNDSFGENKKFLEDFPTDFPKIIVEVDEALTLTAKGYERYRFLMFETDPEVLSWDLSGLDGEPSLIVINFDSTNVNGGVKFYNYNGGWEENETSLFSGKALMYGAAFSEDFEHFNCNREKAFFRLDLLTKMNKDRTIRIMEKLAGTDSDCLAWIQGYTGGSINQASYYCNECLIMMTDLPYLYDDILTGMTAETLESLRNASIDIEAISSDLAKGRNCPTL